ncbi:sulfate transporter family protein [Oricola sp.]|uniref:sulfate transporter family protein n=1 Tax=Oricola sp. TaxID=1979950 RepID=UPI003BA9F4CC
MIFSAATKALGALTDPTMRSVLWKTLGLTVLALIALWFTIASGVTELALPWLAGLMPWNVALPEWTGWVSLFTAIAAGIGLALGLAFLLGPVSALIAGLFLDDVAEHIERADYPADPPGTAMSIGQGVVLSIKFAGVVVLGNLLALALLLVPGVNLVAFFVVNGYLLGREYFEFAARRFASESDVRGLRGRHSGTILGAGLVIAVFLAIPIVNLLTPLFGAALMVHLHKAIAAKEGERAARLGRSAPA